jgi:hypothetical protein
MVELREGTRVADREELREAGEDGLEERQEEHVEHAGGDRRQRVVTEVGQREELAQHELVHVCQDDGGEGDARHPRREAPDTGEHVAPKARPRLRPLETRPEQPPARRGLKRGDRDLPDEECLDRRRHPDEHRDDGPEAERRADDEEHVERDLPPDAEQPALVERERELQRDRDPDESNRLLERSGRQSLGM